MPPSVTTGEVREWNGEIAPALFKSSALRRRCVWLAIACLVRKYVSAYASERPGEDLKALLWEFDRSLGYAAYRWLREPAPDEPVHNIRPRRDLSREEIELADLVASIPNNNLSWEEWNRVGLAIYAASNGSQEGFLAFDRLSAKSSKYDPRAVEERWRNYRRSPPSRIGLGTLVHLARQAGWAPQRRVG